MQTYIYSIQNYRSHLNIDTHTTVWSVITHVQFNVGCKVCRLVCPFQAYVYVDMRCLYIILYVLCCVFIIFSFTYAISSYMHFIFNAKYQPAQRQQMKIALWLNLTHLHHLMLTNVCFS